MWNESLEGNNGRLLAAYMRQRRGGILVFLLFCAIFCVTFLLYHLPVGAVLYPAFLCGMFGCGFLLRDFWRVRRSHEMLLQVREMIGTRIVSLPETCGILEKDYQAVIRALREEMTESEGAASTRYQDMVEYYTVWVHQIKTPITSMRLTLEKEDSPLSRKLSSDLFQIEQYVEMVLAFLRLDSDHSDYVFREQDLDAIVRQSVSKFAAEFIARKIRLDYVPTEYKVVTDEKWLSFVVEQVLSNALKYTREGTIRIYGKGPKTLCIEDTGIGIAPNDLPRVFEKGYTGYNGRKDKRASGIGLYLCKRICVKLGVEIALESQPGKGTCVSLHLEQYRLRAE